MKLQNHKNILLYLGIIFFLLPDTLIAVESFSTTQGLMGTNANLYNGAVSEHISATVYKKNGYSQLNAEVGRNGVDGLYVRRDSRGQIKDIVFSEVKHGKGKLGTIKNGTIKQMSKEWKIIKIDDKLTSLNKINNPTKADKKLIAELTHIKKMVYDNKVKSQITRVKSIGNNKFSISIEKLNDDGTVGKQLKHRLNNNIIDLNKKYKNGSSNHKLQKIINHSVRKEQELLRARTKLKTLKDPKKIIKQKAYIKRVEKSRPNIFKTTKKVKSINKAKKIINSNKGVSAVFLTKGKKTLVFLKAKNLKRMSKFKNLNFMKKVKGGDVIMMTLESGVAVYSVLNGGMSFQKASALLLKSNTRSIISQGFSKGIAFLTPPPATLVVITSIAGAIAIEYAIDKYIELDKRNYISMSDMFWDVPDEIKNKITGLNLEDIKRKSIFDLEDNDNKSIFDLDEAEGKSIFDNTQFKNKKTIFD